MSGTGRGEEEPAATPSRGSGVLRQLSHVGVFFAAAAAILMTVGTGSRWSVLVPSSSPFVAVSTVLATRSVQTFAWIGLAITAVTLIRRRWFCRWVCPTGWCADGAAWLGRRGGRRSARMPAVGHGILLLTLGGACLGYPLLLWLDPLAIFSGAFGLIQAGVIPAVWCCTLGLAIVLVVSLVLPGAWCARLCPLGAMQDVASQAGNALRDRLAPSPRRAAVSTSGIVSRRTVLGGFLGAVWAGGTRWVRADPPRPLRPPGAVGEDRFTGLCIRCGNCARACPTAIVRPDLGAHGVAGLLTPGLDFRRDYCREDCTRCTEVCPSGALAPMTLEAKPKAGIGLPRVDMNVCLLGDDRECSICRNRCPYAAIRLVFSEVDYTLTPQIDPARCNGCGACEAACPTEPGKAIVIRPVNGTGSRRTGGSV